jgi:hypothetical protein
LLATGVSYPPTNGSGLGDIIGRPVKNQLPVEACRLNSGSRSASSDRPPGAEGPGRFRGELYTLRQLANAAAAKGDGQLCRPRRQSSRGSESCRRRCCE